MKNEVSDEDLNLIGRYLRKELSATELDAFWTRVQADRAFADELEQSVFLANTVLSDEYEKVKQELQPAFESSAATEKARLQKLASRRKMFKIAAAIAGILFVGSLLRLYKSADTLYRDRIASITDTLPLAYAPEKVGNKTAIADPVVRAYAEGRFRECTEKFQRTADASALATFCAANAYLNLGMTTNALHYFRQAHKLAQQAPNVEGVSAYLADMISLESLDLSTAEQVIREMHSKTEIHPNVQQLLALKYVKATRFAEADSVLSQVEDVDWEFRMQVKLLKWTH